MTTKKKVRRQTLLVLFCALFFFVNILLCAGCAPSEKENGGGSGLTLLKTDGELIRDKGGTGDVVWLRGTNAGGLGVIELWMTGFAEGTECIDHKTTSLQFIERFGFEKAQALWKEYQSNWWTDADFQNCADMGMTSIRLPFTYMNVDFAAVQGLMYAGKSYDFTMLDEFVAKAAQYGMYTILDLHGAYGSQNGQDHSGEVLAAADVDFYSNEEKMGLTVALWRAIAEHFKDNPNVAAYDILNEPGERKEGSGTQSTTTRHWDFMDRVYDAIREKDKNHIVVFESCWDGNNLPHPSEYGWENCMYSFHHYSGASDYEAHVLSVNDKLAGVAAEDFGVPVQMGEFTCYENEASWEYTLDCLNRNGWHWTSWTYKINNDWEDSAWGIYHIDYSENGDENYAAEAEKYKVNAQTDSEETIREKWSRMRTAEHGVKYAFPSGTTLYDIVKKYCTQTAETAETAKSSIEAGKRLFALAGDEERGLAVADRPSGNNALIVGMSELFEVRPHESGDGSVFILLQNQSLGVYDYNGGKYVRVTGGDSSAQRFFPLRISSSDETVFLSYVTGKYLWYDASSDAVRADGETIKEALKLKVY